MCIYTMFIQSVYLVSDLEVSDNGDPLNEMCVFITAVPSTKLFAGGGGGGGGFIRIQ
jgi:hypothetical protein